MPPRTRSRRLSSSDGGLLGVLGTLDAGNNSSNANNKNVKNTKSNRVIQSKPIATTSAVRRVTRKSVAAKTIGDVEKNPTELDETLTVNKRQQRTVTKKSVANAKVQSLSNCEPKESIVDSHGEGDDISTNATDQQPLAPRDKSQVDASVPLQATQPYVKKAGVHKKTDTKSNDLKTSFVQEPTAWKNPVVNQPDVTNPTPPKNPPSKALYAPTEVLSSPNDQSVLSGLSCDESLCHTANMLPFNSDTPPQFASRQARVDDHHNDDDAYAHIVPMAIFPEDDLSDDGGNDFSKECDDASHVQVFDIENDAGDEDSMGGSVDDDESTQEQEFVSNLDEEEDNGEVHEDDPTDSDDFIVDSDEESDFEEDYVSESDEDEDLEVDSDEEEERRGQNNKVEARTNKQTASNNAGHTANVTKKKKAHLVVLDSDDDEDSVYVERASEKILDAKAGDTGTSGDESGMGSEPDILNHLEMSEHDEDRHCTNRGESEPFDEDERSYQPEEDDIETEDEDSLRDSVDSNGDDEVEVIAEILDDNDLGDDVFDVVAVAECCDADDDDARTNEHHLSLGIQVDEHDSAAGEYESSFDDDDGEETLAFEVRDDNSGSAKDADQNDVPKIVSLEFEAFNENEAVAPLTGRRSRTESDAGYDCIEKAPPQSCPKIGDSLSQAKADIAERDALVEGSNEHEIEQQGDVLSVTQTGGYDGFLNHFQALALEDQKLALDCGTTTLPDDLALRADTATGGKAITIQEQGVSQSTAQDSSDRKPPGAADESFFVMDQTLALQDEVALHGGPLACSSYIDAVDITGEPIPATYDMDEARRGVTPIALSSTVNAATDEECVGETHGLISPISENLAITDDINSEISFISQTLRSDSTKRVTDTAGQTSSDPVSDNELDRKGAKQATGRNEISREGSVRRGKWSLGSKIGTGSFGVVHVGMNTHTGQLMAVKSVELSPAAMKDIRVEVEVLKSLSHVNIVRYLGAERNAQKLHIFQEWVPGGSVTTLLNKFGPFSAAVIRSYLSQILTGLTYLHENRILHRDIKGGNVLVSDDGIVKLADFGSSKRMAHQQSDMMESLTMRGTPYFMAPEVFEEHYNGKADIWSVGCVAFQMATGSPPWKLEGFSNPMSLFRHLQNTEGLPSLEWPENGPMRESEKAPFEEMLRRCFWRKAFQRPTAQGLAADSFFSGASSSEDDASQTLFSAAGDSVSTFAPQTPGAKGTPPLSRLPRRSSFISPPLPRRIGIISSENVSPLDRSPKLVSKDWPSWARDQLKKEVTSPGLSQHTPRVASLMDSLAYSADTTKSISNPFARGTGSSGREPFLAGLQFVDGSLR